MKLGDGWPPRIPPNGLQRSVYEILTVVPISSELALESGETDLGLPSDNIFRSETNRDVNSEAPIATTLSSSSRQIFNNWL
jgi:hypothetical protein